jgi:ABC-type Na+ transport system ATPase subunit NatA
MIEVEHLSKIYGSTTAIQDVSFVAEPGEILGFLGPKWGRQNHHHADFGRVFASF